MKIILTRTVLILALVMMLSGSLVTYAATTLFTQTFPAETFATASLNVGSKCSGGDLVLVPADSTVPNSAGQYAALEFACDSTGDAAFTSTGTTSTTVTVTPTFTLPSGWNFFVGPQNSPTTIACSNVEYEPTSGSPVTLTGGTSYAYCLTSTSASSFSSFTVTWSQ